MFPEKFEHLLGCTQVPFEYILYVLEIDYLHRQSCEITFLSFDSLTITMMIYLMGQLNEYQIVLRMINMHSLKENLNLRTSADSELYKQMNTLRPL